MTNQRRPINAARIADALPRAVIDPPPADFQAKVWARIAAGEHRRRDRARLWVPIATVIGVALALVAAVALAGCAVEPIDEAPRDRVELTAAAFRLTPAGWSVAYSGEPGDELTLVSVEAPCRSSFEALSACVQGTSLYSGERFEECGWTACIAGRSVAVAVSSSVVYNERSPDVAIVIHGTSGDKASAYAVRRVAITIRPTDLR